MGFDTVFGIHSISPYSLTDGLFFLENPLEVVGTFSFNTSQEQVVLNGGPFNFPVDVATGVYTTDGSMTLREFPPGLYEVAYGEKPVENAAETGGSTSTLVNIKGASVFEATDGIDSVGVISGKENEVVNANFTVQWTSATTVDVFVDSDVDFGRNGIARAYIAGGKSKVTAVPLTIATTTAVEIPGFGVELTGGSGTIAGIIGDTASFSSRPINSFSTELLVGGDNVITKKVGLIAYAQKKDGLMSSINIFSASISGLPRAQTEKAFLESELTFTASRATNVRTGVKGVFTINNIVTEDC